MYAGIHDVRVIIQSWTCRIYMYKYVFTVHFIDTSVYKYIFYL